jgi:DNA helicase-2/ATP-dependent DNA helicase PcrA
VQRGTRGMDPVDLNHQAILVRASHQMRAFEDRFLTIGLPYRVIGGPRFYERAGDPRCDGLFPAGGLPRR